MQHDHYNHKDKWTKQPVAWLMLILLISTIIAGMITLYLAYDSHSQEIPDAPHKLPGS